jgi:hypothetical protein
MSLPPNLPKALIDRSFQAASGELGILPEDVHVFLSACERDRVPLLGWELWIADHRMGVTTTPIPAMGQWTGGIPTRTRGVAFFGGNGGLEQTRREIGELDLEAVVDRKWRAHVRFNFTLDGD